MQSFEHLLIWQIAIDAIVAIYEDKLKVDTVSSFESRQNSVADNGEKELNGNIEIEFINVGFRYPNLFIFKG
jgi:hypothetical protein